MYCRTIAIALLSVGLAGAQEAATQPATRPTAPTLTVVSLRTSRLGSVITQDFHRSFNQSEEGLSLLLRVDTDRTLLPLPNDAVSIDTFVDDTYQSLQSSSRNTYYDPYNVQPTLSDDRHSILFSVRGNVAPAPEARRIFVRGSLRAQAAAGKSSIDSVKLPLTAGSQTQSGDCTITLTNISSSRSDQLSLTLLLEGAIDKIVQVRPSGAAALSSQNASWLQTRNGSIQPQRATLNVSLPKTSLALNLEITRTEQIEDVRIPFESQIDMSKSSAGPIEKIAPTSPSPDNLRRQWPPPQASLPFTAPGGRDAAAGVSSADATPFPPPAKTSAPASQPAPSDFKIDLFSFAIAKAGPEESPGVRWNAVPKPPLRANGFALFRLLVSAPDEMSMEFGPDPIRITRYEQDNGVKLSTERYETNAVRYGVLDFRSVPGQQSIVDFTMVHPPGPGTHECTIAGTIHATIRGGLTQATSKPLTLLRGSSMEVGPLTVGVQRFGMVPVLTPGEAPQEKTLTLSLSGDAGSATYLELIDAHDRVVGRADGLNRYGTNSYRSLLMRVSFGETEPVSIRVHYFEGKPHEVDIPFTIKAGVGL